MSHIKNSLYNLLSFYCYININSYYSFNYIIHHNKLVLSGTEKYNGDRFNEWLAGVIDGDGHLTFSGGSPRLIIDMETRNSSLISFIQSKLGGSIHYPKRNTKVLSYYLGSRQSVTTLVHRINGNIRNSVRIPQLQSLCNLLGITYIPPVPLTINNAWFAGMFDADGCLSANFGQTSPRITATITQKYEIDTKDFSIFGGYTIDRGSENHYRWQTNKESDVIMLCNYFDSCPILSHKSSRVTWVHDFYKFRNLKAHKPGSYYHSDWIHLKTNWTNWVPKA